MTPAPVPSDHAVRDCRYCGRRIFFARTSLGKNMPLEARPVKVYTVPALRPGELDHRAVAVTTLGDLFLPHWGNCPGADAARKARQEGDDDGD